MTPYPGLRSFDPDEAQIFFGRDECIDGMLERLRATHVLAVLGSSGIGKSSLVKTGLVAALQMGLIAEAGARWRVVIGKPGSVPLRQLAEALLEGAPGQSAGAEDSAAVESLRARFTAAGARALVEWSRDSLAEGETLLLLIDQFEELFRYQSYAAQEEAEAFARLLCESAQSTDNVYVTITMRSEYLGHCALIDGLAETVSEGMFLVPRMTREQCRQAIKGPAKVCGGDVAEPLVNRLLNDLADLASWNGDSSEDTDDKLARRADQLPLLQFALSRMWAEAAARAGDGPVTLTLRDYEAVVGLRGALNKTANDILGRLGEQQRPLVQAVFSALTAGTKSADATRRPVRYAELVATCGGDEAGVQSIVNAFRAPGCDFLTPVLTGAEADPNPPIAGDTILDITHESLIRQWDALSAWLAEESSAGKRWQRLREDAEQKQKTGLLSGRRLDAIADWRRGAWPNEAWAKRYGDDYENITAFVDESVRQQQWQRRRRRLWSATAVALLAIACTGSVMAWFIAHKNSVIAEQSRKLEAVDRGYRDAAANYAKSLLPSIEDPGVRSSPEALSQKLMDAQATLFESLRNVNPGDTISSGFLMAEVRTLTINLSQMPDKTFDQNTELLARLASLAIRQRPLSSDDLWEAFLAFDEITSTEDSRNRSRALTAADETFKELATVDPSNIAMCTDCVAAKDWLLYLEGWAYWRKGEIRLDLNRLDTDRLPEAEQAFRTGIGDVATFLRNTNKECVDVAGNLHSQLGLTLRTEGQKAVNAERRTALNKESAAEYRKALDCEKDRQEVDREWVAIRATNLARAEETTHEFDEAGKHYREAVSNRMQMVKDDDPLSLRDLAGALRTLGFFEVKYGKPKDGIEHYQKCESDMQRLTRRGSDRQVASTHEGSDQQVASIHENLALCEEGVSFALRRLGRYAEAESAIRAAIRDLTSAAKGLPETDNLDEASEDLAVILTLANGTGAETEKLWADRLAASTQSLVAARKAYAEDPTVASAEDLANALSVTAYDSLINGKIDNAIGYADEAAKLPVYYEYQLNFAHTYLLKGRIADAERLYLESRGNPEQLGDIAEDFAIFQKLGLAVPAMDKIRQELGI